MDKVELQGAGGHLGGTEEWSPIGWAMPFLAGLLMVAAVGLAVAGGLAAFQRAHANAIFPGVRVGDVLVGGMTRERALLELKPLFEQRASRPLLVRAAGTEREVATADLGAAFDAAAAVNAAYQVGRVGEWTGRLAVQFLAIARGYSVESPGVAIDRPKLQSYLAQRSREIDRPVKDAELVIGADLTVRVTPSVIGRRLDVVGAAVATERALATGATSVDLPVAETQPRRLERDLEEAGATLTKMFSGPVALEFADRRWTLGAKEIAALVSVEQKAGIPAPVLTLQEQPLKQMLEGIAREVNQPTVNARFERSGGGLKLLRESQDGRKLDQARALAALKDAIRGDLRVVALPVEVERAPVGSADAGGLDFKERIDLGRTSFYGSVPEKGHNIKLAASRLNGVVVAPGATFSFNKELGPTTLKSGYQIGFGISVTNGQMETVPSVAGGICQVATTLLHAVFWAGYQIEERYPHLYWIASYGQAPRGMVGLDATVDDPNLDFKFTNNTESFLLIESKVVDSTLEFALYGTKPTWKVEVEGPAIANVVKADPKEVRQEEPTMPEGKEIWVERATDGMDVTITRKVTQGSDVRTLRLRSNYLPSRNVLMVGAKKPEATPQPTPSATPAGAIQAGPTPTPSGGTPRPAPTATPSTGGPQSTPVPTPSPRAAQPAVPTPSPTVQSR